jgi:hypothetical protein
MKSFMKLSLLAAFVAPAMLVSTAGAQTFQDGTFLTRNWQSVLFNRSTGGASSAQRFTQNGNPGSYLEITNTVLDSPADDLGQLVGGYVNLTAVWDPSTRGRIVEITTSQDAFRDQARSSGVGSGGGLLIFQDGRYFVGGLFEIPETTWTTKTSGNLTQANFRMINPTLPDFADTTRNPDFSATGAPMYFGFLRSNSASDDGSGTVQVTGIDNWQVSILAGFNPTNANVLRGVLTGGDVNSLRDADGNRFVVRAVRPFLPSQADVDVTFQGTAPSENPATLRFDIVLSASALPARQDIDLFNFNTNLWEQIDSRAATTSDASLSFSFNTNVARFIQPGTREIRARVRMFDQGVLFPTWSGRIDQVMWVFPA